MFDALIESVRKLTGTYENKTKEIDDSVQSARKSMDSFIANSKNIFVNQFTIKSEGPKLVVYRMGTLDTTNNPDWTAAERGYIDLMMVNGRDIGTQSPRKVNLSIGFRGTFQAEHYFVGSLVEGKGNRCHFLIGREAGKPEGHYYLYLVHDAYCYTTIVNFHETTPEEPDFPNREKIIELGNSEINTVDWDVDIIQEVERIDNVEVVYDTSGPATAVMSVGKIRYTEMEQIQPPVE